MEEAQGGVSSTGEVVNRGSTGPHAQKGLIGWPLVRFRPHRGSPERRQGGQDARKGGRGDGRRRSGKRAQAGSSTNSAGSSAGRLGDTSVHRCSRGRCRWRSSSATRAHFARSSTLNMAGRQRLALAQRICPGTCAHSAAVERTAGLVHLTECTAVVSPSNSRGRAASRDPACSLPPGPPGESVCSPFSQLDSVRACAKLTSALACQVRRSPPASPTGRRRDTTHGTHASRPSASGLVTACASMFQCRRRRSNSLEHAHGEGPGAYCQVLRAHGGQCPAEDVDATCVLRLI